MDEWLHLWIHKLINTELTLDLNPQFCSCMRLLLIWACTVDLEGLSWILCLSLWNFMSSEPSSLPAFSDHFGYWVVVCCTCCFSQHHAICTHLTTFKWDIFCSYSYKISIGYFLKRSLPGSRVTGLKGMCIYILIENAKWPSTEIDCQSESPWMLSV